MRASHACCSPFDLPAWLFSFSRSWLNTCIGRRNYWAFFSLALVGTLQHILGTALAIATAVAWPSSESVVGAAVFGSVVAALSFISVLAFGALLVFHLHLVSVGLGTYDWMVHKETRRLEAARAARDAETEARWQREQAQVSAAQVIVNEPSAAPLTPASPVSAAVAAPASALEIAVGAPPTPVLAGLYDSSTSPPDAGVNDSEKNVTRAPIQELALEVCTVQPASAIPLPSPSDNVGTVEPARPDRSSDAASALGDTGVVGVAVRVSVDGLSNAPVNDEAPVAVDKFQGLSQDPEARNKAISSLTEWVAREQKAAEEGAYDPDTSIASMFRGTA